MYLCCANGAASWGTIIRPYANIIRLYTNINWSKLLHEMVAGPHSPNMVVMLYNNIMIYLSAYWITMQWQINYMFILH